MPWTDDIDGAVWDVSLVQGHHFPRVKRVGANIMGVEAKVLKSEIGCVKAQELEDLVADNTAYGGGRVGVVSADWGVGVGTIFSEVEETVDRGGDRVSVLQVGGLHAYRFSPDIVLLIVEEEGDSTSAEEELVQGLLWKEIAYVFWSEAASKD